MGWTGRDERRRAPGPPRRSPAAPCQEPDRLVVERRSPALGLELRQQRRPVPEHRELADISRLPSTNSSRRYCGDWRSAAGKPTARPAPDNGLVALALEVGAQAVLAIEQPVCLVHRARLPEVIDRTPQRRPVTNELS